MPNISPLISSRADNTVLTSAHGVANGLTWTQVGTTGVYTASITVPGVSGSTTTVSAAAQYPADVATNPTAFTDYSNCWLMVVGVTANTIKFYVAANPSSPATFGLSWAITNF